MLQLDKSTTLQATLNQIQIDGFAKNATIFLNNTLWISLQR